MLVAVILAGGDGRRFGGDKLAALVDGEPSVARIAAAAREAGADLVYAATRSMERCRLYQALAGLDGCLLDPPLACSGPGAALLAAAEAAAEAGWRLVLTLPGDTPWLTPEAVARFTRLAGAACSATLLHGDGFIESLLQLHRGEALASMVEPLRALCGLRGELRASDPLRLSPRLRLVGSRHVSPWPLPWAHINTREALRTRAAKNPPGSGLVERHEPRLEPSLPTPRLCGLLRREEEAYHALGVRHLARQAARDYRLLCGERLG
jgi:molybdopterin-guanine dinucleotide biosynthesis protein A